MFKSHRVIGRLKSMFIKPNVFQVNTEQEMKLSANNFFSKCEQTCSFLWISSHLRKKSLTINSFSVYCKGKYTRIIFHFGKQMRVFNIKYWFNEENGAFRMILGGEGNFRLVNFENISIVESQRAA